MVHQKKVITLLLFICFFNLEAQMPFTSPTPTPGITNKTLVAEHFSTHNGLLDDSVTQLEMDNLGFLWIGTQYGLAVYNGERITTIPFHIANGSPPDLSSNIRAMTIDKQDNIWIAEANGFVLRYNRKMEQFERVFPLTGEPETSQILPNAMEIDDDGILWVGTQKGIYCLKVDTSNSVSGQTFRAHITKTFFEKGNDNEPYIKQFIKTQNNQIWATTSEGLGLWNKEQEHFFIMDPTKNTTNILSKDLGRICMSSSGTKIWCTTKADEIIQYDIKADTFKKLILPEKFDQNIYYSRLFEDQEGYLWRCVVKSPNVFISRYNTQLNQFELIDFRLLNESRTMLSYVFIDFVNDPSGNLWFGMHNGGLLKYSPSYSTFDYLSYKDSGVKNSHRNFLYSILVDGNNEIWIDTNDEGILVAEEPNGPFQKVQEKFPALNELSNVKNYLGQTKDKFGNIWLWGKDKLVCYDFQKRTIVNYTNRFPFLEQLEGSSIRSAGLDSKKNLWLYKDPFIYEIDLQKGTVLRKINKGILNTDSIIVPGISEMLIDSKDKVWFGTQNGGFYRFDPENGSTKYFEYSPGKSIIEHPNGHIYAGTFGNGLVQVNMETLEDSSIVELNGVALSKVRGGINIDEQENLWVGTRTGLIKYNPENSSSQVYTERDGLPSNQLIVSNKVDRLANGQLLFGTLGGIVHFHPDSLKKDTTPPKLAWESFSLFDQTISPSQDGPLFESTLYTKTINLAHWQNDFSFRFSALHFKNPQKNRYAARLTPYQKEYRDLGNTGYVAFNNLSPGRYILQVKAANSDGIWNEEGITLEIIIRSPWYWNTVAKLIYGLLLAALILVFYQFQLNKHLAEAEAARLKELDEFKGNLYTNITHEFRTPLTVINGITDQIQGHQKEKNIIHRNSQQLLDLVNQMLELSKLDTQKMDLQLIQGDILYFLRYVVESFHSLALNEKINLNFYAHSEEIIMDYDPEKVLRIISNLISNAIKYTPEYGKILVTAQIEKDPKALLLHIKDTGKGILPSDLPHIFERFYQADASSTRKAEGAGIGLALCKELVELMNGQISVQSELEQGTIFRVSLPITNQASLHHKNDLLKAPKRVMLHISKSSKVEESTSPSLLSTDKLSAPSVLIVEDNADVQLYLSTCLKKDYELFFARNGREGIDKALEIIPDIIISDVMMPEVDGFELCTILKEDEKTSHIPIILLTAKATAEDRLSGLQKGADAYLAKPFHEAELHIRLAKLIELRQRLRQRYSNGLFGIKILNQEDSEAAFLKKVNSIIQSQFSNEDFNVEKLAKLLAMSRIQLYRKFDAIMDKKPAEYIKLVRLHHARTLLLESNLNVGEIAFQVGFKGHAHFSKIFKDFFGVPPSEVRRKP